MRSDGNGNKLPQGVVKREFDTFSAARAGKRTIITVGAAVAASGLAFASSILLVRSQDMAIAINVLGLGVAVVIVSPFLGLLNYLAFIYLRPQEFLGEFKGLPVVLIVGGATFVVITLYNAFRKRWTLTAPQDILVMWLYAALIVSQLATFYLGGVAETARHYASQIVTYMLMVTLIMTARRLRITLYTLLVLTVFQAVQGIYQFLTGANFAGEELIAGRIQGIGIFADPNNLAMTFLMVMPFAILKAIRSRSLLFRLVMIAVIAILIYGLFLTDSRGGFLGLGVIIFTMVSRRVGYKKGTAVALVVFGLLFAVGPSRMREFDTREESAYGRVEAWAEGMDMFQSRPLFGVGARNFMDYHYLAAHNSFIECAAELGLFGLLPWVALLVVGLRSTSYVATNAVSSQTDDLALNAEAVFNGLVGFIVTAMFIARAYSDMFFLIAGLAAAVSKLYVHLGGERVMVFGRKDLVTSVAITFVTLVMFKVYLLYYW